MPLSHQLVVAKRQRAGAVRIVADPKSDRCCFEIVCRKAACARLNPDKGTIKRGAAISVWSNNEAIDGEYIKKQARAGAMNEQLVAIGIKKKGAIRFRAPIADDEAAVDRAEALVKKCWPKWRWKGCFRPSRERKAVPTGPAKSTA